jgi:hypothetical protein
VSSSVRFCTGGVGGLVLGSAILITLVMATSALPACQSILFISSASIVAGAVSELIVLRNAFFPFGVIRA